MKMDDISTPVASPKDVPEFDLGKEVPRTIIAFVSDLIRLGNALKSWYRKFEQADKWRICYL